MSGWIKIHRRLQDWEWYNDSNTVHLFLHLLLSANHGQKNWRGIKVDRGQVVTGIHSLSEKLGMSNSKIRTALEHLKKTGELTSKSTNKYTIITICNYDRYQVSGGIVDNQISTQNNKQTTSKQQANNKQITTTKNIIIKEGEELKKPIKEETNTTGKKIADNPTDYQPCLDTYFEFIKKVSGLPPNFNGAEGKSLNAIIAYIKKLDQVKAGGRSVVEVFKFLLDNFDRWEAFHQKQLKLTQINSNLTNIINSIKNGGQNHRDSARNENAKLGEIIRSGVEIDFRPKKPN